MYDVVVGDVVVLSAGDLIPTGGALFHANDLQVCEKALTGEAILMAKGPSRQGESGTRRRFLRERLSSTGWRAWSCWLSVICRIRRG